MAQEALLSAEANDSQKLLVRLRELRDAYPESHFLHYLVATFCLRMGEWEAAEAEGAGIAGNLRAHFQFETIKYRARAGHCSDAHRLCIAVVEGLTALAEKIEFLDHVACLPLLEDLPAFLPYAEECVRMAAKLDGENLSLQGTLGSLLVEQRRMQEAEPILRNVLAKTSSDLDRGISSLYLAKIELNKGNAISAHELLSAALRYPEVASWMSRRPKAPEVGVENV